MLFLEARIAGRPTRWPVRRRRIRIGRDSDCEIVVDDPSVSRTHARIEFDGEGDARLEDLGSTNGTWLAGRRIDEATIVADEWFSVGSVLMTVRRGVSLRDRDSLSSRSGGDGGDGGERSVTADDAATPDVDPPDGIDFLARMTAALSGDDASHAIGDTLHALVEAGSADGVLLVRTVGNGLAVIASAGRPPDDEGARTLLDASTGGDLDELSAHRLPDGKHWLVVQPRTASVPEEVLGLAGAVLSWLMRLEEAQAPSFARLRNAQLDDDDSEGFVTHSPECRRVLAEIDRLARTGLPMLLLGESGTGKELLARRVHARSARRAGPFVAINCAALPHELLEAEIFGIESGVATGVSARRGRMRQADGGTLFLDEIADLPLALQPKLLRALEMGSVVPLGSPAAVPVDVRFVAATHRDLRETVADGAFREDLFHRLTGAIVRVPPLRERPEDLLPLVRLFARRAAREQGRPFHGIDVEATRTLFGYAWPGNVRELSHAVGRALALADGPILHAGLLPEEIRRHSDPALGEALSGVVDDFRTARARFERLYFQQLLDLCGGNVSEASRRAGLHRVYLHRKLCELGLR